MKKVLIVEDDLMVADLLEEVLLQEGFDVCGIARTPRDAITMADRHKPELAVVDVHLVGGLGTDVAPVLMARYNTGVLYTTANMEAISAAAGHACLPKPFRLDDVVLALGVVARIVESGKAIPPFPAGFIVMPA
jgi:DNA-binding response OmpR family regulator